MEEQWMVDRAALRDLIQQNPQMTQRELAQEMGRSLGWVQKWSKRLRNQPVDDVTAVQRQCSSGRMARPKRSAAVVARVLTLRDELPALLHRVPGPRAILYYLAQDETLPAATLPQSTRTVWQILDEAGRIERAPKREHVPLERAEPLHVWQMDLKDATTVRHTVSDKKQHQVEILNVVDTGTSLLLSSVPRADYNAETVLWTLTDAFQRQGLPYRLTFDRDSRFIGSWSSGGFPSALMRFLACLDIEVHLTPPHRPDKNAYVERFHRTLEYECLRAHCPTTLEEARSVLHTFQTFYNQERPNQALSCGNRPPGQAFPALLPWRDLPAIVDPDRWLITIDGKLFKRRVKHNGSVEVDNHSYYISQGLRGQMVVLRVEAAHQRFAVLYQGHFLKHRAIKGLHQMPFPFEDYLKLMCEEAVSEHRRWLSQARRRLVRPYA